MSPLLAPFPLQMAEICETYGILCFLSASRHKEAVQNASDRRRLIMGVMTKHVEADRRSGRLSYRRV